jgi:CubicO group peptidase (beta-lactamase class C family)
LLTLERLPTSGALATKIAATVLFPLVAACANTPTTVDPPSGPDIATVDDVMTAFMEKYSVPGLSLAITKDERLVYLKAYGRADDSRAVNTKDRFRIASVSKSITSVTIMRLVEQGRLSLDQRVFGTGAILGTTYGTQPYGAGITAITVDELLHHTSGGWPNDRDDPMLVNLSMSIDQLISWTLDNRLLASSPGSAYAYSNFGYAVLGRVIERVTGVSYASAVKTLVLDPAGITDMAIGGNTLADRQPHEVKYYGQGGQDPYSRNVSRMDSNGGWIATAQSLARLLVRVDGLAGKPDLLSGATIAVMTTGSSANPGYAAGWSVDTLGNWWHSGGLLGTASVIGRTVLGGNYSYVILVNTRSAASTFYPDLFGLFRAALAATPTWPDIDLFADP